MHFLIRAYDAAGALDLRKAARASHLENVEKSKIDGVLLYAAAMLDEQENPRGSVLVVNFPSSSELEKWLATEPYVTNKVWERWDIETIRPAPAFS